MVNLETSTPANQAEWFNKMKGEGVLPRYIELGNEFWLGMLGDPNVQKKWPDAPTTMRVMKQYTDTLRPYFVVGTKVAVQATANYIVSWPESAQYGAVTSGMLQRSSFFRTAPSAIAVAAGQYVSPLEALSEARGKTDPRARQIREARAIANTRIQSVASAIAYLLLILHQMGLGAVWMTGPMQAKVKLKRLSGCHLKWIWSRLFLLVTPVRLLHCA